MPSGLVMAPANLELAGSHSLSRLLQCPTGGAACQEGGCGVSLPSWCPHLPSSSLWHPSSSLFPSSFPPLHSLFSTQRKIPVFLNLMLYHCLDLLNSPRVLAFWIKKKKARDSVSSFCFIPHHTLPLRPWTQANNLLDSGVRAVWGGKGGAWRKKEIKQNTGYSFKNIILSSISRRGQLTH